MAKQRRNLDAAKVLGARIKELRKQQGLTQEDLCGRAALSIDAVSRIEHGTRSPTLGSLAKLATALGVSVSTLVSNTAPPKADHPRPLRAILTILEAQPPDVQEAAEGIVRAFLKYVGAPTAKR